MYWPVAVWLLLRLLSSHRTALLERRRRLLDLRFRRLRDRFFFSFRGRRCSGSCEGSIGSSCTAALVVGITVANRTWSGISYTKSTCGGSDEGLPNRLTRSESRRAAKEAMSAWAKTTYAEPPSGSKTTEVTAPCLAHSSRTAESVTPRGSLLMQTFSGPPAFAAAQANVPKLSCGALGPRSSELSVALPGLAAVSASASSSRPAEKTLARSLERAASRRWAARTDSKSSWIASRLVVAVSVASLARSVASRACCWDACLASSASSLSASAASSFWRPRPSCALCRSLNASTKDFPPDGIAAGGLRTGVAPWTAV
mmetsp:Transcript_121862/g.389716  ORF Transcript_121862/g.389716 Transcript_121862/m.389716 type:complete len:315 (+) Transcript_121862:394-1338(+)